MAVRAISIGVERMLRNIEAIRKQVDAWKGPAESAKLVIYQAFVEGPGRTLRSTWLGACTISISIVKPRNSVRER